MAAADIQKSAFPSAIRTRDAEDFIALQFEAEVVQSGQLTEAPAKVPDGKK
jgi:hypothetical protein